ncbi:MAG: polysaccharide biosynthesis tyrosine autokinase [Verrucomicrobiales bacterium]
MDRLPPPTQTASQKLTHFNDRMRRYMKLIARRWWVILLLVSGAICLQAWKTSKLPDEYRSNARIVVTGQLALKESVHYREEMANFYGTQAQILNSGELRRRVGERVKVLHPGLAPSVVNLTIERQKNSSVFDLESLSRDAAYARAYLDALLDEYINFRREMRSRVSENTLDALTEELARAQKRVSASEEELKKFQSENNLVVLEEGRNSSAAYLEELKSKLADMKTEQNLLRRLDIEQDILRRNRLPDTYESQRKGVMPLAESERDFLETKQQIELLRAELSQLLKVMKPKHPQVASLQHRIGQAETMLAIYRKQSEEQNAQRIKSIELQIENLETEVETWEAKALATRDKLNDFQRLAGQVERDQGFYEKLLLSMHDVDQSQNLNQDSVSIMERATAASLVKRDRARPLAMGAVMGGLLALVLLLVIDRLDDKLRAVGDFALNFNEELLGVIPSVDGKGKIMPLQANDDRHMFSEAYRNLRSSLLFKDWRGQEPHSILITSAVPVEGKTTVATNLAITMALAGSRVLLIDADLRRGSLTKQFEVPEGPGLGDIILGEATLNQSIVGTAYEYLALLGRGRDLPACSENFLGVELLDCLRDAKERFDFVVIDSAPVLVADDTTTLAPLADTTLFVMRINATPARLADKALQLLYRRQVNVGGVVLNCESVSTNDYRTYGYYKYYSAPGQSATKLDNVRRRSIPFAGKRKASRRPVGLEVKPAASAEEVPADEIFVE